MVDLTIVISVYGQPLMLAKQMEAIRSWSDRKSINVIIVDDCGTPPAMPEAAGLADHVKSLQVFRIDQDIPWNQMGARNLGMHHAQGWCMMLDPDMVFGSEMMHRVLQAVEKMQRGSVLKFALRHMGGDRKIDMSSPNTWVIHRDDFFQVGGYDEDFAGHKGWSDVQLLDILTAHYKIQKRPDLYADFYGTDQIADAMVKTLDRSTAANRKKRVQKVAQARAARGWVRWVKARENVQRLRFPWTKVFQSPC